MIRIKNELELITWFKKNFHKLGFEELINYNAKGFPDFILKENGEKVRVEIEIKSSNFLIHKHPLDKVDKVICIKKDVELGIPIIELKNFKLVNKDTSFSLKNKILKLFKKNNILTTSEIYKELNIQWSTAEKYLLELALDKKVERIKKTGVNLWMLK